MSLALWTVYFHGRKMGWNSQQKEQHLAGCELDKPKDILIRNMEQ